MILISLLSLLLIWLATFITEARSSVLTYLLEGESDFRSIDSGAVISTLPRGLFVTSAADGESKEIEGQKWLRIEYPRQGWILSSTCKPVSESQVCHDKNKFSRAFKAGDHILGSCVASSSSNWVDQWPVGGSKLGALVGSGASFGLEIVPFSIADLFLMNANHMVSNINFQREYVIGSAHEKSFNEFKTARSKFLNMDLVGADKHLKMMKQEATSRFEYIGDIALAFALPASMGKAKEARLEAESKGPRKFVLEGLHESLKKVRPGLADLSFFSSGITGHGDASHISHLDLSGGLSSSSFMLSGEGGPALSAASLLAGQLRGRSAHGSIQMHHRRWAGLRRCGVHEYRHASLSVEGRAGGE
jgi:hypothetical protein